MGDKVALMGEILDDGWMDESMKRGFQVNYYLR